MKYRRKTLEVEACYIAKGVRRIIEFNPKWLREYIVTCTEEYIFVETGSGQEGHQLPCYFIKSSKGKGAYPMSVESFEKHFEVVE